MKLTVKRIFLALLSLPLVLATIISLPWLLIFGLSVIEPNPPDPEITYGEFPFCLEYSIDGEIFVVEDVVICEYTGVKWNEGTGKYRTWKGHLKSLKTESVLILTDGDLEIYCNTGSADYYMGDMKYAPSTPFTPVFYYKNNKFSGNTDDLLKKYKIELIDWHLSEPIINSFK